MSPSLWSRYDRHFVCRPIIGMVELCAKNLQIMRNDFTDYAHTFCQLCANYARAQWHNSTLPRKVVNNDVSSELPTISK